MTTAVPRIATRGAIVGTRLLPHPLPATTHDDAECGQPAQRRPRLVPTLCGVVAAATLAAAAMCALAGRLLVNITPSMPFGLYWMHLNPQDIREGDLVAFPPPPSVRDLVRDRHYLPERAWLLKPVAAVAGDNVCVDGDDLRVRDEARARLRSYDSDGRPLPRDARCGPLAAGELYVLARDPRSFDSRVFGPLSHQALHATVTPLWTF
jgi:conjugative transfer signal peptidase TraF